MIGVEFIIQCVGTSWDYFILLSDAYGLSTKQDRGITVLKTAWHPLDQCDDRDPDNLGKSRTRMAMPKGWQWSSSCSPTGRRGLSCRGSHCLWREVPQN